VRDVAASFQAAVVETLVAKCARALDATSARALNLGGGVACNVSLRRALHDICAARGVALRIPSPRLCADNAGMIAWVGARRLARGERATDELDAAASLEASGLVVGV
jgi:N6-L-threonylcarbamoyladenine synthase